jgi:hypothetical protein
MELKKRGDTVAKVHVDDLKVLEALQSQFLDPAEGSKYIPSYHIFKDYHGTTVDRRVRVDIELPPSDIATALAAASEAPLCHLVSSEGEIISLHLLYYRQFKKS